MRFEALLVQIKKKKRWKPLPTCLASDIPFQIYSVGLGKTVGLVGAQSQPPDDYSLYFLTSKRPI